MFAKGMLTAVLVAAGMSSHALAQATTEIVTGGGQTTVVPKAATESKGVSPVATEVVSEYPAFNQAMNNDGIASTLLAQGFRDIHILREGSLMTVTATRDNNDINLVYNLVEGRLIKVNGERVLSEDERTPGSSGDATAPTGTEDGMSDDGTGDDGSAGDGTDDGGADDGGTGDTGTDDGGSADGGAGGDDGGSGDAGGNSDSDGGSGSDSGSDSGSTGG